MNSEQFNQWCQSTQEQALPGYQRQPLVMGILNVTPDSFSDGGQFFNIDQAYQHAQTMIEEGVDIIDIGGESTKPAAEPVSAEQELARVIPVIEQLRKTSDICISIDTLKPIVMKEAVLAGASLINDVNALNSPEALETAASLQVPICLMHMKGDPKTMQDDPSYAQDVVDEINQFFEIRINDCLRAGIARERLILDPGFGFGKTVTHNLTLLKRISEFQRHNLPLLLGVSRKSTIGAILDKPVTERLYGSLGATIFAAMQGVSIIRTHDVAATRQALQVVNAIMDVG